MDAVMFHLKGAHLAAQRVGRTLLRPLGITPARFDLMNALGDKGMRQSDLWRRLGVVRSAVCEMVRSLRALGWVKRVRAADGRTWLVQATRLGRAMLERAFEACVANGDAAVHMDAGLTQGHVESDALAAREQFVFKCDGFAGHYRLAPRLRGPDLYVWRAEDYWMYLTEYEDPTGTESIPWVDDWLRESEVAKENLFLAPCGEEGDDRGIVGR
jgi:DNA-binding MarR family transcriptional regulator